MMLNRVDLGGRYGLDRQKEESKQTLTFSGAGIKMERSRAKAHE
jgi:hypothetical protein